MTLATSMVTTSTGVTGGPAGAIDPDNRKGAQACPAGTGRAAIPTAGASSLSEFGRVGMLRQRISRALAQALEIGRIRRKIVGFLQIRFHCNPIHDIAR